MLENVIRQALAMGRLPELEEELDLQQNKTQTPAIKIGDEVLAGAYRGVLIGLNQLVATVQVPTENGRVQIIEVPLALVNPIR